MNETLDMDMEDEIFDDSYDEDEDDDGDEEEIEKDGDNKRGKHECTSCGKRYTKAKRLERHVLSHTGERPFKCLHPECTKSYSKKKHLDRHTFTHSSPTIRCVYEGCDQLFRSSEELASHCKRHTLYRCDFCSLTFGKQSLLKKHVWTHEESHRGAAGASNVSTFKCILRGCDYVGRTSKLLWDHEHNKHKNLKEMPCPHEECNFVGVSFKQLKQHNNEVHLQGGAMRKKRKSASDSCDPVKRPFSCETCGTRFAKVYHLNEHVKNLHSDARNALRCPVDSCLQTFTKQSNLRVHVEAVHHSVKRFSCEWDGCGFETYYKNKLDSHREIHEEEEEEVEEVEVDTSSIRLLSPPGVLKNDVDLINSLILQVNRDSSINTMSSTSSSDVFFIGDKCFEDDGEASPVRTNIVLL